MAYNWTMMIYMAGNCGQTLADIQVDAKLNELRAVGTNPAVAMVAQVHTQTGNQQAYRLSPGDDYTDRALDVIEPVQQHNTGDPGALSDFIIWSMQHYPARHYALIIRGHGTGWKDEDIAVALRQHTSDSTPVPAIMHISMRSSQCLPRALFRSSAVAVSCSAHHNQRGLAYDEVAMDFLDNAGLQQALRMAEAQTGRRLDLIGLDACLMSMIEVAYQIHAHADYLVASQERIPLMTGWPYTPMLRALADDPALTPEEVSRAIVQAYQHYATNAFRSSTGITLAAINLALINNLVTALKPLSNTLSQAVTEHDMYLQRALYTTHKRVQRFADKDFADLHHLLHLLHDHYAGSNVDLRPLLATALHELQPDNAQGIVIANTTGNRSVTHASGLSIYLPRSGYNETYNTLDFAVSDWGNFLRVRNQLC